MLAEASVRLFLFFSLVRALVVLAFLDYNNFSLLFAHTVAVLCFRVFFGGTLLLCQLWMCMHSIFFSLAGFAAFVLGASSARPDRSGVDYNFMLMLALPRRICFFCIMIRRGNEFSTCCVLPARRTGKAGRREEVRSDFHPCLRSVFTSVTTSGETESKKKRKTLKIWSIALYLRFGSCAGLLYVHSTLLFSCHRHINTERVSFVKMHFSWVCRTRHSLIQ